MKYILITNTGVEITFKTLLEANEFAINLAKKGYRFSIQESEIIVEYIVTMQTEGMIETYSFSSDIDRQKFINGMKEFQSNVKYEFYKTRNAA